MKILISSNVFLPSVGGLEDISFILAAEFTKLGHSVKLVTETPAKTKDTFPFEVIRKPNPLRLLKLIFWCQIYYHNNISLRTAWPLLLIRRPWIIRHQTWNCMPDKNRGIRNLIKGKAFYFAANISCSMAIANSLPVRSKVVYNPYDDEIFRLIPQVQRDKELVFLGRLVSDKGADLLLRALGELKQKGHKPSLTIIGSGPEEYSLRKLADDIGITGQVSFLGVKRGEESARLLNQHKILVIPSRWEEPFGIVSLEGIACGCVVIGSEGGGLKEAIGPCGLTFPNNDLNALTECLIDLLSNPEKLAFCRKNAESHLAKFKKRAIANMDIEIFRGALRH